MVQPNSDTSIFCTWLQDSGFYRFSPARLANIAIIKDAADNVTEVTNQQYNDFIRFTAHLYPAFLEYIAFNGLSQYTITTNREMYAYVNTDVTHTGDTNEVIMNSVHITPNSMMQNSKLVFESMFRKVGTSGNMIIKVYLNTVNNLGGSPVQVGTLTMNTTILFAGFRRQIVCKNSQTTQYVYQNSSAVNDEFGNYTGSFTSLNVNFAIDQYLIFTCKLGSAADTAIQQDLQVYIDQP